MADTASQQTIRTTTGTVSGGPCTLLRLEVLTLFASMTLLYAVWGGAWWIYLVLFLAPDLSFLGYLAGPKGRRHRLQRRA